MANKIGGKNRMRLIYIILVVMLYSCNKDHYYTGYIMRNKKIPLVGAKIYEQHSPIDTALTDSTGFFELRKHPQMIDYLIVERDQNIDTIDIIQRFGGNEQFKVLFTSNKKDTIYLRKQNEGSREH